MLSFIEANKRCLIEKVVKIQGRAPRSEFWWFMLGSFLISIVAQLLTFIPIIGAIISLVVSIYLFVGQITCMIRRFHDLDKSGWWILCPYALYALAILLLIIALLASAELFIYAGILAAAAGTVCVLVFMVMPGTKGPNRYGEDPFAETYQSLADNSAQNDNSSQA